jgi:flavodoxin I
MKALVVYDSESGDTRKIAEAIVSGIELCDAVAKCAGDVDPASLPSLKLLIVGSSTTGLKPSAEIVRFINSIPGGALDGVNVTAFDVRIEKEKIKKLLLRILSDGSGYAARPVAENLRKKGGTLVLLPEPFYLESENGPLREGETERAVLWGRLACHA